MKKILLLLPVCALACFAATAQSIGPSTLNAAGGSAVIGGSTFEYAVGDVVAGTTLSSATLVVTQGVLQPARTSQGVHTVATITGLDVYPSPVTDLLYLQPHMTKGGMLQYVLYDAAGKLVLKSGQVALQQGNERQEADVRTLAAGHYLLQVQWTEGGKQLNGAYKIQKIK